MTDLEKLESTFGKITDKINQLTNQINRTKRPEDYMTSTVEGAAGYARTYHQAPPVRDDQPTKWEAEYEQFLDDLNEEGQEDEK